MYGIVMVESQAKPDFYLDVFRWIWTSRGEYIFAAMYYIQICRDSPSL